MSEPSPLAVLGAGAMGSALLSAWLKQGLLAASQVRLYDPARERVERLAAPHGVSASGSAREACCGAETVLLAVKPGDAVAALQAADIGADALVLSIAAGLALATLEAAVPGRPVIRLMPNTAATVGQSATAYALGSKATERHAAAAAELFSAVGLAVEVPERYLNAVTGLSGSGPAYVYLLLEALADGGVNVGLPRDIALQLAAQTVLGAATMVLTSGDHPAQLKDRVCSPGGTTIAGVAALEEGGFRSAVIKAVGAAKKRADELG